MEVLENLRFNKVARLLTKTYKKGDVRHIRNRLHTGFVFTLYGKTEFVNDDKVFIGDEKHVMLAPQGFDYDVITKEDSMNLIIDFELASGFFNEMYNFNIDESKSFYKTYLNMEKQYYFPTPNSELIGLRNLYDITARIIGFGKKDDRFKPIELSERYLETNVYDQKLSISEIAKASNISEVYFRRLFKDKYNISPYEYINEKRIKKAKDALIYDDDNISEIALSCGFSNIYSFSRAFKKSVGISPSDYKKKYIVSK